MKSDTPLPLLAAAVLRCPRTLLIYQIARWAMRSNSSGHSEAARSLAPISRPVTNVVVGASLPHSLTYSPNLVFGDEFH